MATPCAASRAAKSRDAVGLIVEQSTTSVPGEAPADTPSGPKSTASTSGESDTQMTTTSEASATAAGLAPWTALSSSNSAARPADRFQTVSGKPARRRLAAMAPPMVPSPQNPTRSNATLPI